MTGAGRRAASQFSASPKIGDAQIMRLAYYFCHGLPVAAAARGADVTTKTARDYYIALRARLASPTFARWHGANAQAPSLSPEIAAALVRPAYFDTLAECHANEKCRQNYRLGYRASRTCRACPLAGKFTNDPRTRDALALTDAIRDFYVHLGIRGEKARDPVSLFRERLIHTVTITAVLANSRDRADGLKDPLEKTFLSLGTMLDRLLESLAENPL